MVQKSQGGVECNANDVSQIPTLLHRDCCRLSARRLKPIFLSEIAELEIQKLVKILSKPGNLKIDLRENDANWSNGFSVCLDAKNKLGFDNNKLNDGLLYAAPRDLAAAWKDICKLPLSEWLFESKGPTKAAELTIENALSAEYASVELYDLMRSQSKLLGRHESSGVPSEFFAVVYMLAIVASETYLQIKISSQPAEALRKKAVELTSRDWLTDSTRTLLLNFCSK